MRKRLRRRLMAAGLGAILGTNFAAAQPPSFPVAPPQVPPRPVFPAAPQYPTQPQALPPAQTPAAPVYPASPNAPSAPAYPAAPYVPPPPAYPTSPQYPAPPGAYPSMTPGRMPGSVMPAQAHSPLQPTSPQLLPAGVVPQSQGDHPPGTPGAAPAPLGEVALPHPEQKLRLSAMDVQVKRAVGGWQVCAGQRVMRDFGDNETAARDAARVLRDMRPTEWVTIGGAKPVVEYGLTNGRPAVVGVAAPDGKGDPNANPNPGLVAASSFGPVVAGVGAKVVHPVDLRTARVEPIRGVWCVRDDDTILFNFGTDKAGAEQTVAVIHKYGFNRVGVVGDPAQPAMSYLFASLDQPPAKINGGQLFFNAQVDALTRTGIPVAGVGFVGEMVKIDAKKVEARKEGAEWVVAAGPEVLGQFGRGEWAAREAARTVQDAKFTEFCRLGGTTNLTFFLKDGKAPTRAPFNTQGRTFDRNSLKAQQVNGKWAVTEGGKFLFDVGSQQEGEIVVRVLAAYGFDQFANISAGGAKGGIQFLVKNR